MWPRSTATRPSRAAARAMPADESPAATPRAPPGGERPGPPSRRARIFLPRDLPEGLEPLTELALDLRWTWCHGCDAVWREIDRGVWERTANPWLILQEVSAERLQALSRDPDFVRAVRRVAGEHRGDLGRATWLDETHPGDVLRGVGYFSLEFGFGEALPLYAGGLGILAADHLKAASDLGVPVFGVGLLYQEGYFRQFTDASGSQHESYPYNDPLSLPIQPAIDAPGGWMHVTLELPGRRLLIRVWRATAGNATLFLLDTNDPLNGPVDRAITGKLYGGGPEVRLLQELVLGVGGCRALEAAGVDPEVYHLNEGHAAFVAVERARRHAVKRGVPFDEALWATRAGNVFTTHTPLAAGFDLHAPGLVERYYPALGLGAVGVPVGELLALGRRDGDDPRAPLNMAYLALRTCARANGVSRLHGQVSRELFRELFPRWPVAEVPVRHVTNGVHVPTWDSIAADRLWTQRCGKGRWLGDLGGTGSGLAAASDEELWAVRTESRHDLVRYARRRLAQQLGQRGEDPRTAARAFEALDANALTLGFARRFTEYKRPNLLLADPERFARLLTRAGLPVQIVVAGKAHPEDLEGKRLVQAWVAFANRPDVRRHVLFLEDYDHDLAQRLVGGVDVWVNTPRRRWEACGTSGMKVLANGGLNLSELDGWWAEAFGPEVGWALHGAKDGDRGDASDADRLLRLLEEAVVPAFYERDAAGLPRAWIARMRESMARLTPRFSANRMVREYTEQLYLPAAGSFRRRTADGGLVARELARWHAAIESSWSKVRIGNADAQVRDGVLHVEAQVYGGELPPEAILVEAYADPATPEGEPVRVAMQRAEALPGAVGAHAWRGDAPTDRAASDFTVRVLPHHPEALVPAEQRRISWQR